MSETKAETERGKARKAAREAADQIERSFPPETSAPLPLAASMHVSADTMKHWMETGQDMAKFYNGRFAKDLGYMTELAMCRSPADLTALWFKAASETVHDYANQFDRVLAINLNGQADAPSAPSV